MKNSSKPSLYSEPEAFVSRLKNAPLAADVFTFSQRVPDVVQKFQYRVHWDNRAAIRITTYADWLDNRAQYDVKKAVKRAKKLGVVVRTAVYDDAFVEGIRRIYDESPIRQNQVFWHYHKDFATVKRENGTFLDRSEYIGAYYNDELIGFIKMVYVGSVASTFQVISQKKHSDKKPTNALIAKAVEICEQKGLSHFVYGRYSSGDPNSSLTEFKRRNGFEQIMVPKYYLPLTARGRVALSLNLHQPTGRIPDPVLNFLREVRRRWRARSLASPTPTT